MNILITENQYKKLLKEHKEENFKSAVYFDSLYGTNLSHKYFFGKNVTSDDVWNIWSECRDGGNCDEMKDLMVRLQEFFPHYDLTKIPFENRAEIIMGMASEYNPSDIVAFSIHGITYENNVEQKRLEKQLPTEVADNIRWVLSPDSIQQIRNKFGVNEI
jgi:hypothetical protein